MGSEYPTRRCAALLEFVGQLTLRRAASSPLPLKKKRLKFNGADGSPARHGQHLKSTQQAVDGHSSISSVDGVRLLS